MGGGGGGVRKALGFTLPLNESKVEATGFRVRTMDCVNGKSSTQTLITTASGGLHHRYVVRGSGKMPNQCRSECA